MTGSAVTANRTRRKRHQHCPPTTTDPTTTSRNRRKRRTRAREYPSISILRPWHSALLHLMLGTGNVRTSLALVNAVESFNHNSDDDVISSTTTATATTTSSSSSTHAFPTFSLHPTSVLAIEKEKQRRLSRTTAAAAAAASNDTWQWWNNIQNDWFHPNSNAVYATLPKYYDKDDDDDDNNTTIFEEEEDTMLQEFHKYRHLSRYERDFRLRHGLDLEPYWNGLYTYDDDDETKTNDDPEYEHYDSEFNRVYNDSNSTVSGTNTSHIDSTDATNDRRQLRSSPSATHHFGGRFNNYQAVALSQGYGTHYASAWVGHPTPQRKTLIVDTGSHYTAFPCTGCKDCGLKHHTDPYYSPEKSDTFHVLQCNECREGVTCQDNDKCIFSQSYTEGSSWEAYQVRDRFYCGGNDYLGAVDPLDQKYMIDFMFGCQLSLNGLFVSQLADGIIGMSMYDTTLTKQMYSKGKLEHNMFALCYRRELGSSKRGVSAGSMMLGGVSNSLDTSPMIYAKNMATVGFYTVYVKNIYIRSGGGQSAKTSLSGNQRIYRVPLNVHKVNSGKGVIVDSGTTDTYLNKNMAKGFNKMWKKVTGREYSHSPLSLDDEQLRSLPTILVQCQAYDVRLDPSVKDPASIVGYAGNLDPSSPTDLLIAIPATNYMEFSPRSKQYASRVYFTETSGGVLGSNTMQGHNVVFDWENGRIGFAESTCAYDRREAPKESQEGRYSENCALGPPVLSRACILSVQEELCDDNNPSNVALVGTETWTMIVEQPGTAKGVTCADVARKLAPENELGPSTITCEGGGVCFEERPCQMTCEEKAAAKKVAVAPAKLTSPVDVNTEEKCGDSFWGACDYRCNQTRVESTLYTDGLCHENRTSTRRCHVDACGRSDPCRVPFIVHAIFVFRGVSPSRWTRVDEDVFTEALSRSYHALAPSDRVFFGVGDIKVVLTRSWVAGEDSEYYTSSDNEEEHEEEMGIKIVVQISIHNPDAQISSKTSASSSSAPRSRAGSISEMVKNITGSLRNGQAPPTACKDSDLFALAKDARIVAYGIPELPTFMAQLIFDIHAYATERGVQQKFAFSPIFNDDEYAVQSRLLSSWTIRTDVDDEINYFGPPEPLFFTILRYVHRFALLTFCISLFVFVWGLAIQAMDFFAAAYNGGRPWLGTREPSYRELETEEMGSVNHIREKRASIFEKSSIRRRFSIGRHRSDSILGGSVSSQAIEFIGLKTGDVRNVVQKPNSPKKRRNSGIESDRTLNHQPSV